MRTADGSEGEGGGGGVPPWLLKYIIYVIPAYIICVNQPKSASKKYFETAPHLFLHSPPARLNLTQLPPLAMRMEGGGEGKGRKVVECCHGC